MIGRERPLVTPSPRPVGLSKSRFMAGLQCHKQLWWLVHGPPAPDFGDDPFLRAILEQGARVGQVARTHVPGGVLIAAPYDAYDERLAATREALNHGAPVIYEASFRADNVFVSVDILERRERGFGLIEVKSSTGVRDYDIADVAIQTHVLRRSGVDVTRMEVMHLNRDCVYPDLRCLFARHEVTDAVEAMLPTMAGEITRQLDTLRSPLPHVAIGEHCHSPYECPFLERCWPALPPHHIGTLYSIGRRAQLLQEQGFRTIEELPPDLNLSATADRQRRAVQAGKVIVEPELKQALELFSLPIAFLDFETVGPAIPVWNGCRPYDAVPVQFSCHRQDADGTVTHEEWLADGPDDPRPQLAERLIAACERARTVVAYSAGFERQCLEQLAELLPRQRAQLQRIPARLVDLLQVVRSHVYHPAFGGSFSLKRVLPALVPEMRYDGLVIADGATASATLERMLLRGDHLASDEKQRLREALLTYCRQDTVGLVRILQRLRELAG